MKIFYAIPANGNTGISTTVDLSWTNPTGTTETKLYFDDFDPPTTLRQSGGIYTSYDPTLAENDEYFWRVDIVHALGTETGDTYSFETAGVPPPTAVSGVIISSDKGGVIKFSSKAGVIRK